VKLIDKSLQEESQTDEELSMIAEQANAVAIEDVAA
jgi:ferritin-like metal-binding protein YciE